jgi:acylphosphatase
MFYLPLEIDLGTIVGSFAADCAIALLRRRLQEAIFKEMLVARRFIIDGEVQGVGFRYFTLRAAARHQVLGIVRNLPDGRVEVIAEGEREAMDQFKQDLAAGPRLAEVRSLDEFDIGVTGRYRDFRIDH